MSGSNYVQSGQQPTRITYVVRCRSQFDGATYVDMTVLVALAVQQPDGTSTLWVVNNKSLAAVGAVTPQDISGSASVAQKVVAIITDNTGSGLGTINPANKTNSMTRVSHAELFTSQTDTKSAKLILEILDGFSFQPPVSEQALQAPIPGNDEDDSAPGAVDSGQFQGPFHYVSMQQAGGQDDLYPDALTGTYIADPTGLGITSSGSAYSRSGHINIITSNGNTDDGTSGITVDDSGPPSSPGGGGTPAVNPKGTDYIVTLKLNSVCLQRPNGGSWGFVMPMSGQAEVDCTNYNVGLVPRVDPYTGENQNVPPDNTDPNFYAYVPQDCQSLNLQIPQRTPDPNSTAAPIPGPVDQGLLWWMKKLASPFRPWYWYCPEQTPLAFGYFAGGGTGLAPIHWAYRGFQLLNYYPVIWILAENNPLQPMGTFGANGDQTPNDYGEYPEALDIAAQNGPYTAGSGAFPILPSGPLFTAGGSGVFCPFGYLPMMQGPPVTDFVHNVPTIWQLTGVTAPKINPRYGAPLQNYYFRPSAQQAQDAAQTFADMWNSVANACNNIMWEFCYGGGGGGTTSQNPAGPGGGQNNSGQPGQSGGLTLLTGTDNYGNSAPAGWKWKTPYINPYNLRVSPFNPGLQPGLAGNPCGLPLEVFEPATIATIAVGQLDPAIWDQRLVWSNSLITSAPTLWDPNNP